jgi:ADP-heptose:LPS heptosyltransferase
MKKYLIIRFSSIGDIVLTTPVLRLLKKQDPTAQIHYVTKKRYAALVAPNPYVSKVHVLNGSMAALIAELRAERFDCVVDLHRSWRSFRLKAALRRKTFTFRKQNWRKWLLVHFKQHFLPISHVVDRYVDAAPTLRSLKDDAGLDFFMPQRVTLPISLAGKLRPNSSFVVVVLGAQHATKRIPPQRVVELCSQLTLPVLLLGGRDVAPQGEEVARLCPGVRNACGQLSIHQSALLMRQARAVVTPDTGMMHIAAALKKNVVSLWGSTVPELGMSPYLPGEKSKVYEVQNLRCRPCSKIGFGRCPRGHFRCMNDIDYGAVARYVNSL